MDDLSPLAGDLDRTTPSGLFRVEGKRRFGLGAAAVMAVIPGEFVTGVLAQLLQKLAGPSAVHEGEYIPAHLLEHELLSLLDTVPGALLGAPVLAWILTRLRYRISYQAAAVALLVGQVAGSLAWLAAWLAARQATGSGSYYPFSDLAGKGLAVGLSVLIVGVAAWIVRRLAAPSSSRPGTGPGFKSSL